jgi:biopolymer transport protein ExbD
MAMSGPGGGRGDDDLGLEDGAGFTEINITPLTDIFLVLLIIFMVTSSVIVNASSGAKAGLKVNLPTGGSADVAATAKDLSVAILSDGRLVLAGEVVTSDDLKKAFDQAKTESPDTLVIVQADEGVPHGKVVEVMELAKAAGLGQLAIGVREGQPGK